MGNMKERVAYLQGLTKGLNVNEQSAEGKLLLNIIDVLDSFAEEVYNVNLAQRELEEYVESIDEDLTGLEEQLYDEDCDGVDEVDDDTDDEAYDDEAYDDDDMVEMACPSCHELVTFESNILDEEEDIEVTCPYCGQVVYDNALDIADTGTRVMRDSNHIMHPGV
ncbi:MAG TPA: AraC family transcriptional regulator [Methylomusa anaerophila]|uniref:AraC family transcriptional regulator n=1 Tax=Methylomusa anaerophila TaxID=1930071 RepID=A0A348APA7_9FIRM|nr:CD1247 N-terminal domain-containing protein [Methylomusa anaerophila]BBB92905.1 hypothetical protein MAMMFC1_03613 [Methylomusa anaerophila]HML87259.1 AraC family transcriptional regulator [Methylomusa anaerophila]